MITAIAIDDEPLPLEVLQQYCDAAGFVNLQKTFTKVSEAQKHLKTFPVELLFLDIQMPKISGIDFYKAVAQTTMVIFTTAHSQYAIEGFNLSAVDYLLKPYSYNRFLEAAKKAEAFYNFLHKKETTDLQFLYIRSDYSLVQIAFSEILFIESFADYLDIHLADGKKQTVRMTMKSIAEKLPSRDFIRVHRSYIVSLKRIEKVRKKCIFIAAREIPLSANHEEAFFKIFSA